MRLAEMNGLPDSGFVFVHRDELLIEMTEEYMIYMVGSTPFSDYGNARLCEDG